MTAEQFAKYNADCLTASARAISWIKLDEKLGGQVERVAPPREVSFPAPFTGEEIY